MIKRIMTDVDVKAGIQHILKRIDVAYEQRPKVYMISLNCKIHYISLCLPFHRKGS